MKNSWATSRVKWLNGEKTNVSSTISVLIFRVLISTLVALEFFTIQSRRESYKSCKYN
jgi:hypothetical protein